MPDVLKPPPIESPRTHGVQPLRPGRPAMSQDVLPTHEARPSAPSAAASKTARVAPRRFIAPKTKAAARRKRQLLLERVALIAAVPAVVIVSARLSVYPVVGEALIAVYGVVAVIRHIPARISFWLASMVLVSIGVEMLLLPGVSRPNNTALFVFLLLAVGLVSSMFETRRLGAGGKHVRRR